MVSTKRGGTALGAVLVVVLTLAGTARADHAREMRARQDFAAGRYDEALELFAKLYAETLNPIYMRNIGRCHQKLKQPDKAIDAFQDYLTKGKKISADEKAEINGYIKEMEALRDQQAQQAQAQAQVRGQPAVPPVATPPLPPPAAVQPIPTAPEVTSPGYAGPPPGYIAAPPAADPGAQPAGALVAQPAAPAATPVYKKWWFWTIVGAAVAGGIVTAVILGSGTTRPDCTGVPGLVCK